MKKKDERKKHILPQTAVERREVLLACFWREAGNYGTYMNVLEKKKRKEKEKTY
jgi:hypothetical protein